ncbi:MAG: cysteine peptidase family C39 domain-containing protein [Planctomycetota bacterium]|jgi:hypothetical protein
MVMNPWLETIGVVVVALLGVFLGRAFSRFRKPYWLVGYFLPLALIAVMGMTRFVDSLAFVPPICWVITGRVRFVVFCLAATMGLTTPLSRLPYRFERAAIWILMVMVVVWFSIFPFLVPALMRGRLLGLRTMVDSDGLCYQTTNYTCAPAAAVTALRRLGLPASEGEIAVLAHTSPMAGTLPWCLSDALGRRYGADGLKCQYRRFDSVNQLKDADVTLAVVKDMFLLDHCVAVLEVCDRMVTVADPVLGESSMSHAEFEQVWRFSGITLKRDAAAGTFN